MSEIITSIFAFVLALGLLVAVHEYGHFEAARRLGVKVLRFCIGFGRPIWSRVAGRDQVEYAVAAIPLGGYVKLLDEREGPVPERDLHRAFTQQTPSRRIAILAAGPAFNFLFAILAYWLMFVTGVVAARPLIGGVSPGSCDGYRFDLGPTIVTVPGVFRELWRACGRETRSSASPERTRRRSWMRSSAWSIPSCPPAGYRWSSPARTAICAVSR